MREVPVKKHYTCVIYLNMYNFFLKFHNAKLTSYKRVRSEKLLGPPEILALTTCKGVIVFVKFCEYSNSSSAHTVKDNPIIVSIV